MLSEIFKIKSKTRRAIVGYVFLSPVLFFYFIFFLLPLIFSFLLSFMKWGGFDLSLVNWVGFDNYISLFREGSSFVHPILTNTLIYAFGTVILCLTGALFFAVLMTRLRLEGFWRTFYFLPMITTVVAIGNVWTFLYDPNKGLINFVINRLGFHSIRFLSNPDTALYSVVVVAAWAGIGGSILILTAGIKNIPETYYEAAIIDGANTWRLFWNITLPLLRPSLMFVMITGFISGLQSFTLTLVMTRGGPANATNVVGLEMYYQAFQYGSWGVASAMAFVLFIIVLVVTLVQLRFFRKGGIESY